MVVLGAVPGTASAGAARLEGDTVVYDAPAGEDNTVAILDRPEGILWEFATEEVPEPWAGCAPAPERPSVTRCPASANARIALGDGANKVLRAGSGGPALANVVVSAGDGDDRFQLGRNLASALELNAGGGEDSINSDGSIRAGDGADDVRTSMPKLIDAGGGNDRVLLVGHAPVVNLGAGDDTLRMNTLVEFKIVTRISGGAGRDEFIAEFACLCTIAGGAGDDKFNLVNRMKADPRARAQRVDGGAGRDSGRFDGMDCLRGIEKKTLAKRLPNDRKWRCRSPKT